MNAFTNFFAEHEDTSAAGEDEYIKDGLKYCKICNFPRQCFIKLEDRVFTMPTNCKCQMKELEVQEAAKNKHKNDMAIEVLRRGITDKKYLEMRFDVSDRELKFAHKYVDNFDKYKREGVGLMLLGSCGTGKTFAAACIANALIEKKYSVYMAHIIDVTNQLSKSFDTYTPIFIEKLKTVSLLVVDDFGVQRNIDFIRERIDTLTDIRSRSGKPLIITSNLTLEDMRDDTSSLNRAYDRLKAMCHPIIMNGESRRKSMANTRYKALNKELGSN